MTEGHQAPEAFGIGRLFWLTSDAIVAVDLESERIVLWNPAAERLFGYSGDEALAISLEALVPEELRGDHLFGIRRYRQTGQNVLIGAGPVAVPALARSGERKDIELTLTDVSDLGSRRFVLAIIRDISEQRRAERERAAAYEAMRMFVATASHDLRTPLTVVLGYARLLQRHGDRVSEERRSEALAEVLQSAQQASRLVQDLLTLSQIQAGAVSARRTHVQVAELARRARDAAAGAATIAVDDALTAVVDVDHLERILVNYLSNAQRYGAPPIEVVAAVSGASIDIRVCDAGPGVPEDFRDRLFTTFARANPQLGEGTGLGLSIVKGLAEANGGRAFYERHPEGGSCFGITLPAAAL